MNPALLEYGRALRRRWRWIVWGLLLTLGATALCLLVEPPRYRSEATVFVRTPGDVSLVLDGGDSYAQGRARTYSALARSTDLAGRVVENAGLDVTPEALAERIAASPRQGTALIDVSVDAASAAESRRTATVFFAEYAATVRTLESVPGSLVPRAELIVVDPPRPPKRVVAWGAPVSLVLLGATLAGLLLGATAAVVCSIFDNSVRDPRDAIRFSGRPLLGSIGGEPGGQRTVDTRRIRQRLLRMMDDAPGGVITVTEPEHSSATATAAAFLASVLAERNPSVVLVDLDLRSAESTQRLSDRELPGVTDVLGERCTVAEATVDCAHSQFLGAGRATDATTEMIDSAALRTMIADLRQYYTWVVIACPAATEAAAIADASDMIVLAVREGVTTDEQLRQTSTLQPVAATCAVLFDRGDHPEPPAVSESDVQTKATR
jgi:capsular polysaccharide biosynthesis protein